MGKKLHLLIAVFFFHWFFFVEVDAYLPAHWDYSGHQIVRRVYGPWTERHDCEKKQHELEARLDRPYGNSLGGGHRLRDALWFSHTIGKCQDTFERPIEEINAMELFMYGGRE